MLHWGMDDIFMIRACNYGVHVTIEWKDIVTLICRYRGDEKVEEEEVLGGNRIVLRPQYETMGSVCTLH